MNQSNTDKIELSQACHRFADRLAEVSREQQKNDESRFSAEDRKTWSEIVKKAKR